MIQFQHLWSFNRSQQLGTEPDQVKKPIFGAVRQLAHHYHNSPNLITEEEIRQYFPYIKNVKKYLRVHFDNRHLLDQVPVRQDTEPRLDDVQACTSRMREEAAGDPERGSADDTGAGETAAISSVFWTIYSWRLRKGTHISARGSKRAEARAISGPLEALSRLMPQPRWGCEGHRCHSQGS